MKPFCALLLVALAVLVHGQQLQNVTNDGIGNSANNGTAAPGLPNSQSPSVTVSGPMGNGTTVSNGNFTLGTAGNNTGNNTMSPSTSTLQPAVAATAISTNDSSLSVFPLINGQLVRLGPCTGLAIHTHDYTELATADPNNKLPLKMAYVDPTGAVVTAEVLPGDTFVIPAGLIHYQINYGCSTGTFLASFPRPAYTQLVLPSLAALPDILVYLNLTAMNAMGGAPTMGSTANGTMNVNMTGNGNGALNATDLLANVTAAVTNPIPFVVNPICAQRCA